MKKIVITQSNYIPWRGYFDLINASDEFVFLDEVQFTRRDWRNRNRLIFNDKITWLTIPLKNKGNYFQKIKNMETTSNNWISDHLNKIGSYYSRATYYKSIFKLLRNIYEQCLENNLSKINRHFIYELCQILKIKTKFIESNKILQHNEEDPSKRILSICLERNANYYLTGLKAKQYLNTKIFEEKNIKIIWFDYGESKKYDQVGSSKFVKDLSIIDCLFNCGVNKNLFLNS